MVSLLLAHADTRRALGHEVEYALVHQPVINDRVRVLQRRKTAERQKRRVPRPCPDECYRFRHVSSSACRRRRAASLSPSASAPCGSPVISPRSSVFSSALT